MMTAHSQKLNQQIFFLQFAQQLVILQNFCLFRLFLNLWFDWAGFLFVGFFASLSFTVVLVPNSFLNTLMRSMSTGSNVPIPKFCPIPIPKKITDTDPIPI